MFLLPILFGARNFKMLDSAAKIFLLYAVSSFLTELTAFLCAVYFKTNLSVYNVFNILNFTLITLYFRELIKFKQSGLIFNFLILVNTIVWLITLFEVHSLHSINSTFLGYQGILTMCLSVYLMEHIVFRQNRVVFDLRTSPHFLIAFLLLVFWCFSIMQWILYRYFTNETFGFQYLDLSLTIINMIINFCFALVFIKYPKMIKSNGH
jgi:hypothetical protein